MQIHNHRFINHVSILVSLEWVSVYSWACRYNTYPSMLKECWSLINDSIADTPDHRISLLHSNLSTIMGGQDQEAIKGCQGQDLEPSCSNNTVIDGSLMGFSGLDTQNISPGSPWRELKRHVRKKEPRNLGKCIHTFITSGQLQSM